MQYPKAVSPEKVTETLKKKLSTRLQELNKVITKEDRDAYMKENDISQGNLSLYLNGTIYDLKKAANIIKFFTKRISDRNQELEEVLK